MRRWTDTPTRPVRLTRRGRAVVVGFVLALAFVAGLTADAWSPCAGDHVCVLQGGTP